MQDRACVQLVDVRSTNLFEFRGHSDRSDVACCQFLGTGEYIASASKAGELFLWRCEEAIPTRIGEKFVQVDSSASPRCTAFAEADIRRMSCAANRILVSGLYSAQVFEIQNVALGLPILTAKRDRDRISVLCSHCGWRVEIAAQALGQVTDCSRCGGRWRLNRFLIEDWLGASASDLAALVLQRAVDSLPTDPRGSLRELQTLPDQIQALAEVNLLAARGHCEVAFLAANQERDLDLAVKHLEKAADILPESREIRLQLVEAKKAQTQVYEASLLQYALEGYSAGNIEAALQRASEIPTSSPVYRLAQDLMAKCLCELGMSAAALGELDRALDYLRQARECRPRDRAIAKAWRMLRAKRGGGWLRRLVSRASNRAR
jgi:hypothetical protein